MSRELVFTPAALADLEEIFWFIAADNPTRARSYIAKIEQACQNLCETPLKGRTRPDLRPGLYVFLLWRRILIAYELPGERVDVLRIFSGGQDYEAIMAAEQQAMQHSPRPVSKRELSCLWFCFAACHRRSALLMGGFRPRPMRRSQPAGASDASR